MSAQQSLLVVGFLVLINFWTYKLFALDKYSAKNGLWRISEQTLLMFAFAGGSAGAVACQRVLRHKTRKEPFRSLLRPILGFHAVLTAGVAYNLLARRAAV